MDCDRTPEALRALSRELHGSVCWGRPAVPPPVDDDITTARRRRELADADAAYERSRRAAG